MADTLASLEEINQGVAALVALLEQTKRKWIDPATVRARVLSVSSCYFEHVRPELVVVSRREALSDEIDFPISKLIALSTQSREKNAYLGQLRELGPLLSEATVQVLRAKGRPPIELSQSERNILDTLAKMSRESAAGYRQVIEDVHSGIRTSWRGTALELREVLRQTIDALAPDTEVMAAPGFQKDANRNGPTQSQKVRHILKSRRARTAERETADKAVEALDALFGQLAREAYNLGSAAHASCTIEQVRTAKGYVDALLLQMLALN